MSFGTLLGVVVSLCSVGAGALGVAVLFFLYPKLPPVASSAPTLPTRYPSPVDWHIVGALLLGSLPGIYIGSHLLRPTLPIASCSQPWPVC